MHNTSIEKSYMKIMSVYDVYTDSNIVFVKNISENEFDFKEIYKYSKTHNFLITNSIGKWKNHNLAGMFWNRSLANERKNLRGAILGTSVVILDNDTLNHLDDYRLFICFVN